MAKSNSVFVGTNSEWANHFIVGRAFSLIVNKPHFMDIVTAKTPQECVGFYRLRLENILNLGWLTLEELLTLRGKALACDCPPESICHKQALEDVCNRPLDEWPWTIDNAGKRIVEDARGCLYLLPY